MISFLLMSLLSLTMILEPHALFVFNTKLSGSLSKSISSALSHTPRSGIRYSSPIFSFTHSRTAYLSARVEYSGLLPLSLRHWIISVNLLGLSKSNSCPILSLYCFLIFSIHCSLVKLTLACIRSSFSLLIRFSSRIFMRSGNSFLSIRSLLSLIDINTTS